MKLYHTTILDKLFGLIRFYVLKVFYFKKAKLSKVGLIGRKNEFSISKKGSVKAGAKFITGTNVSLVSEGKLTIGNNFFMNAFSRIVSMKEIRIGNNVTIAMFVSILDHDHDFKILEGSILLDGYAKETIVIGNNVWIGDKVTITKGVKIGDNVIIAANSVVVNDVPSNVIVGGVPVKVLRKII